jgi:hypothetical protein
MSAGWSRGETIRRFHLVMDSLDFPEDEIDKIEQLVQVGEWKVALENLCTQLCEYDVKLPKDVLSAISELGREVGVDERYWSALDSEP